MPGRNAKSGGLTGAGPFWRLAWRGFVFHWRSNALFCAGCAVSAVILIGALLTGSSLKGSIRGLFEPRLGDINWVLTSSAGQFRESIADSVSTNLSVNAAPVFMTTGSVSIAGGEGRVHRVNIIGVDDRFWELGPGDDDNRRGNRPQPPASDSAAILNTALAIKLNANTGDQIIMRFQNSGAPGMDAPFGMRDDISTLRLPLSDIIDADDFGDFSLKGEHFTVYNVFVPLKILQSVNNIPQMANAVIINKSTQQQITDILQKSLSLKDAGLNLRAVDGGVEIYSDGIFINDNLKGAITNAIPTAIPVSAWFVNSINNSDKSTPYSFVSSPPLSRYINDNNIELTEWAARDIGAAVGDSVTLTYFVPANSGQSGTAAPTGLRVDSTVFVVSAIHNDDAPWINKSLMPPYPGLADAGSCTDWDPSIPVDLVKIRTKDEDYWNKYQGTPKAIISYEKAARIWANRFGVCTAIRIPGNISPRDIESAITPSLTAQLCGMRLTDIRASINNAVNNGTDFAPLFLGLSFFTFAASLILIWLLSTLQVKSRAEEFKILTAVGYTRRHILLIYLIEGMIIFSAGTILGILISPFYTLAIIAGLKTVWSAAAMTPVLNPHIEVMPVIIGGLAAFVCAAVSMLIPIYSLTRANHRKPSSQNIKKSPPSTQPFTMRRFILLNILRDKKRRTGEASVLALALLILGTTQLFRTGAIPDPSLRSSGTGGFTWYGELNSGIPHNQTGIDFLLEHGTDVDTAGFLSLAMRMRDGDDASCLSLNRSSSPALVGVDQRILDSLGAFSFASVIKNKGIDRSHPWKILGDNAGDDRTVYGITDANTIEWGLGKSPGDKVPYIDESGDTLNVILAAGLKNSIFQGKILIAESDFIRHFPSISGYRILLLSADVPKSGGRPEAGSPAGDAGRVKADGGKFAAGGRKAAGSAVFGRAAVNTFESFHDRSGLQFESTSERLNAFNSVQNAYLSIFALLGMAGLVLGCAGMGIIVARGIEERRAELALLMVQGFSAGAVRRALFAEHAAVVLAGALCGLVPAALLSWAAVDAAGVARLAFLLTIVLLFGIGSVLFGLRGLRQGSLLPIIKNEVC
ncbi:MAG: FtsX-like permease family protein [Chitinispirillia bacterium]|nr:FtsX-like permease family protein [Chitinispirillia bacterium]